MSSSIQLPVVRDIQLIQDAAAAVPINLGVNLSAFGTHGVTYSLAAYIGNLSLSFSIVSASAGSIVLNIPAYTQIPEARLRVVLLAPSAEDPSTLFRTLAWGNVSVVTPATISASSPIYHAVVMVAGDEFTFNINLNTNLTGRSIAAAMYSFGRESQAAEGTYSSYIPVTVISPTTGLIKLTIDEDQSRASVGGGASWWLRDELGAAVLRAGPVTAYLPTSVPATPENASSEGAAASSLGSVFL